MVKEKAAFVGQTYNQACKVENEFHLKWDTGNKKYIKNQKDSGFLNIYMTKKLKMYVKINK